MHKKFQNLHYISLRNGKTSTSFKNNVVFRNSVKVTGSPRICTYTLICTKTIAYGGNYYNRTTNFHVVSNTLYTLFFLKTIRYCFTHDKKLVVFGKCFTAKYSKYFHMKLILLHGTIKTAYVVVSPEDNFIKLIL